MPKRIVFLASAMPLTAAEVKAKTLQLIADELDAGMHKGMDLLTIYEVLSKDERRAHQTAQGEQLKAIRARMAALREQAFRQRAQLLQEKQEQKSETKKQSEPQETDPGKLGAFFPGTRVENHDFDGLTAYELKWIMHRRRSIGYDERMERNAKAKTQATFQPTVVDAYFEANPSQIQYFHHTDMVPAPKTEEAIQADLRTIGIYRQIKDVETKQAQTAQLSPLSQVFSEERAVTCDPPPLSQVLSEERGVTCDPPPLSQVLSEERAVTCDPPPPNLPAPGKTGGNAPDPKGQPAPEAPISKPIATPWDESKSTHLHVASPGAPAPGLANQGDTDEKPLTPYDHLAQKQLAYYDYPDPNAEDPPD